MAETIDIKDKQSIFNKARKDKFILVLTLPPILRNINTPILSRRAKELVQLDSLQFSVWGSVVPEIVVPEKELGVYGQHYKVTSQARASYPPVQVYFTIDNRFSNYWVLWKWLEILNHPIDSGMPDYFADWDQTAQKRPISEKQLRQKESLIRERLLNQKEQAGSVANVSNNQQISMVNDFLDYQTIITVYAIDEYNTKMIQFDYSNAFITKLDGITYSYRDPDEMESSFTFSFNQLDINLIGPETT